ncbi:hypothetical protein [Phormidium nigroviride]
MSVNRCLLAGTVTDSSSQTIIGRRQKAEGRRRQESVSYWAQGAKGERRRGNEQEGTRNEEYGEVGDNISNFTIEILDN